MLLLMLLRKCLIKMVIFYINVAFYELQSHILWMNKILQWISVKVCIKSSPIAIYVTKRHWKVEANIYVVFHSYTNQCLHSILHDTRCWYQTCTTFKIQTNANNESDKLILQIANHGVPRPHIPYLNCGNHVS